MVCRQCGKSLVEGASFCVYCGHKVDASSQGKPDKVSNSYKIPVAVAAVCVVAVLGIVLFLVSRPKDVVDVSVDATGVLQTGL